MLTFTIEELIRFLSNRAMTFFEGAKRSDDIVFSHYYSFFKRPVLVKEHQVESLYVMVQDRDSSDGKKPSFSRFAKWEFGGFIVDSKTIYMASKTVKELLQNSDFIDDMDVFEKLDSIRIPLFRKNIPADPAMFQDKLCYLEQDGFSLPDTVGEDADRICLKVDGDVGEIYICLIKLDPQ